MILDWRALRRRSVPAFLLRMAELHPELERQIVFDDMVRIANREGITVRAVDFPTQQKAQLVRIGRRTLILVNRAIARQEQAVHGMHELCHFWRDDPGVACYYSDELTGGTSCEFADVFAWVATSPARPLVPGLAPEAQLRLRLTTDIHEPED